MPIVIGSLVLGNMADMAYGNKLARVTKEAEYIMEFERESASFPPNKRRLPNYTPQKSAWFSRLPRL